MKRLPKIAGAGPIADYTVGQRVMTVEGFPGTIEDILEGPGDLTTIFVTLDNGMGGGEYAEAEVSPLQQSQAAQTAHRIDASVEHTAADDYPELGTILTDRMPPEIRTVAMAVVAEMSPSQVIYDLIEKAFTGPCPDCGAATFHGVLEHHCAHTPQQVAASLTALAGAARTHADDDDYDDDLNYPSRPKSGGVGLKGSCKVCGKAIRIEKGVLTHADGSNEHAVQPAEGSEVPLGVMSSLDEAASRIALTLEPKPSVETDLPEEDLDPSEERGYRDGVADGKAGTTRNPQDPTDLAYRAGYDRGWAFGVQSRRQPVVTDFAEQQTLDDAQTAGIDSIVASKEGGFWTDLARGDDSNPKYDGFKSFDWCRYRRDHHCFYSKNLDTEASKRAGYAIWIPEDRGICPRKKWTAQQACPMALPGKNVPGGFTDATTVENQMGGSPSDVFRHGSLDPSLAFHVVSTWKQVQDKAKRIRTAGGVRVVASKDGTVVGHVRGDTNVYEAEIVRVPGRRSIGSWACGCKWGSYSWGRSGPWKKFEGRMCSHTLALQYEAQARGMFDRAMTLDEKQPTWMDSSIPVRTPNSYDRDKGRYSSLHTSADTREMVIWKNADLWEWACTKCGEGPPVTGYRDQQKAIENGKAHAMWCWDLDWDDEVPVRVDEAKYANLRPVVEQQDERPLASLVAAMQAEGTRYAEVRDFVLACGVEDVPSLVREARKTKSFPAKVRGLIRNLFIDDDGTLVDETTSKPVAQRDVLFPNWDPVKGINDYRGDHEASLGGGCGCGGTSHTASPVDDHFREEISHAQSLEEAARALLALARREEPSVTRDITTLAGGNHGKVVGLEHRFKSEGSLLRKMRTEMSAYPSAGACALGMSDPLRYTITFPPDSYTEDTKDVIEGLSRRGYSTRVKNYWLRGDAYNGVNVALKTPDGFPMELQFHTDQSLRVKEEQVHPIYEKWRVEPDSNRKAILGTKMRDLYDMVPRPAGALGIADLKRQPMVPYNQIQWFPRAAAAAGEGVGYHYFLTDTGHVVRVPEDFSATEVWSDGHWADDPAYATYTFLGDPRSDQIDEHDALAMIGGFMEEVSYEHDPFTFAPSHSSLAIEHDEPEAALPVTYGDDEEEEPVKHEAGLPLCPKCQHTVGGDDLEGNLELVSGVGLQHKVCPTEQHEAAVRMAEYFSADDLRVVGQEEEIRRGMSAEEILSDQARAAAIVAQVDAYTAGLTDVNPLAHLGLEGGTVDNEIAAAAQAHLAKEALKTYSPAEKKAIIDEGLDIEASNLDRLDIKGTHYEALAAATSKAASLVDAEDMWMLDGDPNGTD